MATLAHKKDDTNLYFHKKHMRVAYELDPVELGAWERLCLQQG